MPINNPPGPVPSNIVTGSYAGNSSGTTRQITIGFKCSMVIVLSDKAESRLGIVMPSGQIRFSSTNQNWFNGANTLALHATDGIVVGGDASNYFNATGTTYYYWARQV